MAVLMVGLLGYSRSISGSVELEDFNRETALATEAVRRTMEGMRGVPFAEIYARYNADPLDDPIGATSPGHVFAVEGLELREGDADGMQGEILFPSVGSALREDVVDDDLEMPRDLNLDGTIDTADHAGDYAVLPVLVRIEWRSGFRERELEVRTFFSE